MGYGGISLLGAWIAGMLGLPSWAALLVGFLVLPVLALGLILGGRLLCAVDDARRRARGRACLRRMARMDPWEAPDEMYEEELNRLRDSECEVGHLRPILCADRKSREYLLRYLAARRDIPAVRALLAELGTRNDPIGWRARRIMRG